MKQLLRTLYGFGIAAYAVILSQDEINLWLLLAASAFISFGAGGWKNEQ